MDGENDTAGTPRENTPLLAKRLGKQPQRAVPSELDDGHSSIDSGQSSYGLCGSVGCNCASGQPRGLGLHTTPRSFTPDFLLGDRSDDEYSDSSSGSESLTGHQILRVASYDLEYSAWRAMWACVEPSKRVAGGGREAEAEDDSRVACISLCWPSWLADLFSSKSTPPKQDQPPVVGHGQEPAPQEPMRWSAQGYPSRSSTGGGQSQSDTLCNISRYYIKLPPGAQHPRGSQSKRVVIVECDVEGERSQR